MKQQKLWYWFAGLLATVVIFGAGIAVGGILVVRQSVLNEQGEVQIDKVLDLYSKTRSSEVSFDQFWEVWDNIKEKHVNKEIKDVDLMYAAIQGLVAGVGDPYSVYFPPQEAETFAKDLAGEFDGIGAEIGLRDDILTVIAPLPQSPAEKAGLQPGHQILAIDDEDTYGMTIEAAVSKIRGKKGTPVMLTIKKSEETTSKTISIIRDVINVPTVVYEVKEKNIAYLRIHYFNGETWKEFDNAVRNIIKQNPKGLILDLRSNPGGFLDTSIDVASEWIGSGVIVSERLRNGDTTTHTSTGSHRLQGIKTIVLVDGGTASGSEIVAGALQDYGVATIIGQTTYGKGSVQDFEPFADGSALKLTIATWFTPKQRQIDKHGIEPDIIVDPLFEIPDDTKKGQETIKDFGIEKAIELLK